MILATHHFRCHIAGRARGILAILWFKNLGDSHISDANVAILFHDDVLRFDVTMDNSLVMHVLQAEHHACNHELCLWLCEPSTLADVVSQVTSCEQIRDQVQVFTVLEGIINVDEEWMLQLFKQLLFAHDGSD